MLADVIDSTLENSIMAKTGAYARVIRHIDLVYLCRALASNADLCGLVRRIYRRFLRNGGLNDVSDDSAGSVHPFVVCVCVCVSVCVCLRNYPRSYLSPPT